jgi:hypothetical protein
VLLPFGGLLASTSKARNVVVVLVRYRDSYPVDELVSDVFPLAAVEAAVERSVHPDSLKVVISPWAE